MSDDNPNQEENPAETETVDLGEAGKKALAAERARANALEKKVKAMELAEQTRANAELSELERFKKEADDLRAANSKAELEAIRYAVALEKGLPANLAARLQGNDRESIEADAVALSELVGAKPNGPVRPDPSQGPKSTVGEQSRAQQFADALNKARGQ